MYLNLVQIAESFGVSEKAVEGWIRHDGLPHTADRGRLLFDRAQVAEWAAAHGLAARAGFLAPETAEFATGCKLEPLLRTGGIWRDVRAAGILDVFDQIIAAVPGVTPPVRQLLSRRLRLPDGLTWAPVGDGFALPHPSSRIALGRESGTLSLVILTEPLSLKDPTPDGIPVTRLFFFIAPSPRAHLDVLGRLGRLLSRNILQPLLGRTFQNDELLQAVAETDRQSSGEIKEGQAL